MRKKIAVVLSGCGVFDGAEIHEAVFTLYGIAKNGADYQVFAPDINQHHVINHMNGEEMDETRNVLIESSRISRGSIKKTSELDVNLFDGIIFPGGFGVAKNLCSFAFDGAEMTVNKEVENIVLAFHKEKKPIGALCISPVLIAKIIENAKVTIGQDTGTIEALLALNAEHVNTNHGEVVVDKENQIFTTPCYMLDADITDIANGAENLVKALIESIS